MTYLSWDLKLLLTLVTLAGAGLLVPPLWHIVTRLIQWYRVRQYSQAYLPHSMSCKPWGQNTKVLR